MKGEIKVKTIVAGIIIFASFLVLSFILPPLLSFLAGVKIEVEFFKSPGAYIFVIFTGALIAVSGFLPYNWGKVLREIAYFCSFILLVIIELGLVKEFIPRTTVSLDECKTGGVFPSKEQLEAGGFFFDALKFASCVMTGYFPAETGNIGWTSFYIFYLILPFAFAWTFLYGLMSGIGMETWFGAFGKNAMRLLSFIIALYAARLLFGAFLLDLLGYGAWGLIGVFGAVLLTKGLQKIMEGWYRIEEMAAETREAIKSEIEAAKEFRLAIKPILERAESFASKGDIKAARAVLGGITKLPFYKALPPEEKEYVDWYLTKAKTAGTPQKFHEAVAELERFLKG